MGKQYGLILKKKESKPALQKSKLSFFDDDDSDENTKAAIEKDLLKVSAKKKMNKQTQVIGDFYIYSLALMQKQKETLIRRLASIICFLQTGIDALSFVLKTSFTDTETFMLITLKQSRPEKPSQDASSSAKSTLPGVSFRAFECALPFAKWSSTANSSHYNNFAFIVALIFSASCELIILKLFKRTIHKYLSFDNERRSIRTIGEHWIAGRKMLNLP